MLVIHQFVNTHTVSSDDQYKFFSVKLSDTDGIHREIRRSEFCHWALSYCRQTQYLSEASLLIFLLSNLNFMPTFATIMFK